MTTEDIPTNRKTRNLIVALILVAVAVAFASSVPAVQNAAKALFSGRDRQILAKVSGYYGQDQIEYLILKLKDANGLQIEVYEKSPQANQQVFKQKFELTQDTDAYLTLDKNTTNLALTDVDKDGVLDIVAPSVDRNGNLRLNTFRYNSDLNIFEPYQEK